MPRPVGPCASRGSASGLLPLGLPLVASGFGPASRSVACGLRLGSLPRAVAACRGPSLGRGPPPLASLRRVGAAARIGFARLRFPPALGVALAPLRAPCSVALRSAAGSPLRFGPLGGLPLRGAPSPALRASPLRGLPSLLPLGAARSPWPCGPRLLFPRRRPLAPAAPAAVRCRKQGIKVPRCVFCSALPAEGAFFLPSAGLLFAVSRADRARGPAPRVVAVKGRAVAPAGPLERAPPLRGLGGQGRGSAAPAPSVAILQGGPCDLAKCPLDRMI